MSIHRTKAGSWEVRWREGSRNRGRTFDRKADAQDFHNHVRRQSQLGEVVPTRTGQTTLAEYFAKWLATRHGLAPRTVSLYESLFERHILEYLGFAPLASITPQRIEEWQAQRLAAGAGKEAITKAAKLLYQVFKRAVMQEKITRNPVIGLEKPTRDPKEITPATPRQVEEIRAWFLGRERIGDAVLVSVMAYGGLRVGEALGLKWEDFSKGNQLWISRSLEDNGTFRPTKNRVNRLVTLPDPAAQDLVVWRRERGAQGLVFPRPKDGSGWTRTDRNNWRRRWFDPAKREAGWTEPLSKLRHSCASLKIVAGSRPTEVAEDMGHSLQVSVRVYQRIMREMVGQPTKPVDEMIWEARSAVESAKMAVQNDPAQSASAGVRPKELSLE